MNEAEEGLCDVARRFFTALSDGDLEAMRPMLHPDATWEVMRAVPGERSTAGRDAIIDDFLAPVRGRFAPGDPKVTVHTLFASGDRVAAETHGDGTMRDGSEYHNRYAWVIEIEGSLVRSVHEYMDTAYARSSYRPVEPAIEFRRLDRTELSRVAEIDRRERIDVQYVQHGTELVARHGNWSSLAWDPDGHGEHSVEAQIQMLEHYVDAGGIALGAFAGDQLVGIGAVVPHLRPGIAQLAYLMVSAPFRATGVGSHLCEQLDEIARTAGDSAMVVTATPTENTVRFYLGRGFQPMAEPLAELFELEPEDVHMHKVL